MKKISVLAVLVVLMFVANAMAVGPGKTISWDDAQGKVTFSVDSHKAAKCNECHPKLFKMKKGETMKMADLDAGKFCGECHNGTKAFKTSDKDACAKCHKK
jgi:c(7)-type cytochrome triheme protein